MTIRGTLGTLKIGERTIRAELIDFDEGLLWYLNRDKGLIEATNAVFLFEADKMPAKRSKELPIARPRVGRRRGETELEKKIDNLFDKHSEGLTPAQVVEMIEADSAFPHDKYTNLKSAVQLQLIRNYPKLTRGLYGPKE